VWEPWRGEQVVQFFETVLTHTKGEWANQPLRLEPWQVFILSALMSWRRDDGHRRFRTAFVELPRGNSKSTMAAGLALWLTFFDGEPGAETYAIATKREQARIVFDAAKRMVSASSSLRKRITTREHNLHSRASASKFLPLGADANTLDGLRAQCVIADEVHAHQTSALINVMLTSMGTRRQPLLLEITTAGVSRTGPWWEHREYTSRVLDGIHADETWFGLIAGADAEDDWTDEATWRKANPNWGVSVKPDFIAAECRKARAMPLYQNDFRRLHLGQLVQQEDRVISLEKWRACGCEIDWAALKTVPCYGGLDLSTTTDISAFVLVWMVDGVCYIQPHFWIPEDRIRERSSRDRVPYDVWSQDGSVHVTPGNVIDHRFIRAAIQDLCEVWRVAEIGYDPWSAIETATQLEEEGITMVPIRQGFASLAEPTKRFLTMIEGGTLRHPSHPVLDWMADNLAVEIDAAGNMKPSKKKARERIDGMVATVTALARGLVSNGGKASVYATRGLLAW
jgi:phage terminase large subunit-like protein